MTKPYKILRRYFDDDFCSNRKQVKPFESTPSRVPSFSWTSLWSVMTLVSPPMVGRKTLNNSFLFVNGRLLNVLSLLVSSHHTPGYRRD